MLSSAYGWLLGTSLGFLLGLAESGKSNLRDPHAQKLVLYFFICTSRKLLNDPGAFY